MGVVEELGEDLDQGLDFDGGTECGLCASVVDGTV
jgi:hypothetical protein